MKKKFIKQISLLAAGAFFLIIFLVPGIQVKATGVEDEPEFVIENGVLTGYNGSASNVVIPNGVTSINGGVFNGKDVESITIPESVTSIGAYAFNGCEMLSQVSIPASVSSIDMSAFSGCTRLSAISIASGNGSYSTSNGCIYNASGTSLLYVPAGKNSFSPGKELTTVATESFSDATVKAVTLQEGVTTVQDGAFSGSGVEQLSVPESVSYFGLQASWTPKLISVYRNSYAHLALKDAYGEDIVVPTEDAKNPVQPPSNQGGSSSDGNGGNNQGGSSSDGNGGNNQGGSSSNGNNSNNQGGSSSSNSNIGSNSGNSNSGTNNGSSNTSGSSNGGSSTTKATGTTGSSHVKDNTPTTGDRIDAKYFLFAGVLLIGVYLLISKRNVKDDKKNKKK